MRINVSSYIPGTSVVHACDARVKIVLLAAYSVTLFLVDTWAGLVLCAALFAVAAASSGIPLRRFFALLVPVYVLAAFAGSPSMWARRLRGRRRPCWDTSRGPSAACRR